MPAETRLGLFASVRHAIRNREMAQQAKRRFELPDVATDSELERFSAEQRARELRARKARWGV